MLLATESEKNVETLWIEILYEDELDDVIMIQDFEKFTEQDIWLGDVRFSFGGNQTIIVKGIIDGELKQDSFQIDVEEPTTVPVWLGWLISTCGRLVWFICLGDLLRGQNHESISQRCYWLSW